MPVPLHAARLTRREALALGAAAGASGALMGPAGALAAPALNQGGAGPDYLRRATYLPLVGEDFTVGRHVLKLTAVGDVLGALNDGRLRGHDEAFALEFAGVADALDHDIHVLSHPLIGPFPMFIGPAGAARGMAQTYAVVVDRSVRLASAIVHAPKPDPSLLRPPEAPAPAAGGDGQVGPLTEVEAAILEERRITAAEPLVQRRRRARRARRRQRAAHDARMRFKRKQRERMKRTRGGWLRHHGR